MTGEPFKGQVKVASRIIDYLSSGLYESPAACLKELINNSYDADASDVEVYAMPDADCIVVADDGHGFNREEFERHFDRISESHKRDRTDQTTSGRPKIGKIGIGFIAANEICNVMEIFSTKCGETSLLHVNLNFSEMRKSPEDRKSKNDNEYIKGDYEGEVLEANKNDHYTRIFLQQVYGLARIDLLGLGEGEHSGTGPVFYGRKIDTIEKILKDSDLKTWEDLDRYSKAMLEVGLNVPVQYFDNWVPKKFKPEVRRFEEAVKRLQFNVSYDGVSLRKPTVFPEQDRSFISSFHLEGDHVAASGYFYAQHGTIRPQELQGVLLRIRNAAVGDYDSNFWGFSKSEFSLIQRWVSGEIWADDRLEAAMNIDRRTLRVTHPAYVELRDKMHEHLRHVFNRAKKEIYQIGSEQRREASAAETRTQILELSQNLSKDERMHVAETLENKNIQSKRDQKTLLRKYTVPEIIQIVNSVGEKTLDASSRDRLLAALIQRLNK